MAFRFYDPDDQPESEELSADFEDDDGDEEADLLEDDVEERIDVATHYKLLLRGALFEDSDSKAAKIVEKRIRSFVKKELRILLGLETPVDDTSTVPSPFTDQEVDVLKALAAKMVLSAEGKAQAGPRLATVTSPEPKQPAIKKAAPTPKVKSDRRVDTKPDRPKPKERKKRGKKIEAQTPPSKEGDSRTYRAKNGEVMKEVIQGGRRIREYYDQAGKLRLTKDVTPQVAPPGAIPMPSPDQMEMVSSAIAQDTVAALSSPTSSFSSMLSAVQGGR